MKKNSLHYVSVFYKTKKIERLTGVMFACCLFAAGCASPLKVGYDLKPPSAPVVLKERIKILVMPFDDERPGALSNEGERRTIGRITVLPIDMAVGPLVLDDDVSVIAASAFAKELSYAGYTVRTPADADAKDADFALTGSVRAFKLDIGNRDEIEVELQAKFSNQKTGKEAWSGIVREKDDRYAGSSGNSRRSISSYIALTLQKVFKKAISEASPMLTVSTPTERPSTEAGMPEGSGRLMIKTDPGRAKVYINDVYYGLTPAAIDMEPGVYGVTLKMQGYKAYSEKTSVRKGSVTEVELKFDRE